MHFSSLTYKIADTPAEFDQIYHLNYETFVKEIPQYQENSDQKLIDRFDKENLYVIAKNKEEVIGMICVRGNRPFSLDDKLADLDQQLKVEGNLCEIRLLSIKQAYRQGLVFFRLCSQLVSCCLEQGFTIALISGTTKQLPLYKRIGFIPFGPLVGSEKARYQPMYLTEANFLRSTRAFGKLMERETVRREQHFLPGPVNIPNQVQKVWAKAPFSHRASAMHSVMADAKQQLLTLTNGHFVEIALGTGTMANDIVAAQLSCLRKHGAVIASGEFGERLIQQAKRWNLSFHTLHNPDWKPHSIHSIERLLTENPGIEWLWTVHCETSTGYLYPLDELKALCQKFRVRLCLDACSSVGTVPVDLSDVYLASTVSGKGLASYPGLSIVFHQDFVMPNSQLPYYLDLGHYQQTSSIPFTHSSNALSALTKALEISSHPANDLSDYIHDELLTSGMKVIRYEYQSPAILTICLPNSLSSKAFGDKLKTERVHISYESDYLLARNWIQLALMGELDELNIKKSIRFMITQFKQMSREEAALL